MPDFEKVKDNYQPPEITANFIVLYKDESTWLEGWISLEDSFEKFLSLIQGELEYSWNLQNVDMKDYITFHIDLQDKNKLKEIKNNQEYLYVRQQEEIYLVVLHKEIKYRIIENLPPVFEWFMETYDTRAF
ncbi:MAG: hypothetical protein ACFFB0_19750 [Promethearchaeota archaeon]